MYIYRFALPHASDYAGYDAVSSVRLHRSSARSSLSRWYTPISHPHTRGFIEFAMKDCDPGRMSAHLRALQPGEVMYLGRWMREFRYRANAHRELSVLCSTAAASVALQLMTVMCHNPQDRTRLRLLYCHRSATHIPFRRSYWDEYVTRYPDRVEVRYNALVRRPSVSADAAPASATVYYGMLNHAILQDALSPRYYRPPPRR